MKNVAVILSGSGVYDGSEIHEAVLTLLAIEQNGASYRCYAPNIEQHHVINHANGEVVTGETRNVMVEAARISRGDITDITELDINAYDALIVPGGFGAAKNLGDFALKGEKATINEHVLKAAQQFAKAKKPAGYMCIAPTLMPFVYGKGVKATIGTDKATAEMVSAMGVEHCAAQVDEIVVDEANKVVTTPAYMLATSISEAATGINKLVAKVLAMA